MPAEETAPFRYFDLPLEIQTRIIEIFLEDAREEFRPLHTPVDPLDTDSVRSYDFTLSAYALRCHSLPSFSLVFVNKHVSSQALRIVFNHSSIVLYAEISRMRGLSCKFGYVPKMTSRITSAMCANARDVTFEISVDDRKVHRQLFGPPTSDQYITNHKVLRPADEQLRLLINMAKFSKLRTLHVVLQTNGI